MPGGYRSTPSPPQPAPAARQRLLRARETASMAGRVVTLAVLLAITAVCVAAGLGPAILGPRWLGIVLLTVAVAAVTGVAFEGASVRRALAARSRRRHDSDLARQVYS